ncbi:MAG: RNA polymerase sigma factor [Phycisphaerales bacterium]
MTDDARDLALAVGQPPGSHEAFARIYDRHAPVVRALCRRHSASGADADDALQNTSIRTYRMLDRVDDPGGLRARLYRIASLVCSERRWASLRRRSHDLASLDGPSGRQSASMTAGLTISDHPFPRSAAEQGEQPELLTSAPDELADAARSANHLYYFGPDPVRAAKDAIGCSRRTRPSRQESRRRAG